MSSSPSFSQSLLAGAVAGTSVDVVFFPLDTLKTRLQAKEGFLASGGFRGIYRGLTSVVIGSAPGASLFFVTYDTLKARLPRLLDAPTGSPAMHMLAASGGEVAACLIRVPTEVVKQRQQTSAYGAASSTLNTLRLSVQAAGIRGLYRGYSTTVMREIPFACVQFPLYERLKLLARRRRGLSDPLALPAWPDAAICGSLSGGFAAAVTTPLDVAKTRIMLNRSTTAVEGTWPTLRRIYIEEGARSLFRGIVPRTLWMGFGGSVFLGMYELVIRRTNAIP